MFVREVRFEEINQNYIEELIRNEVPEGKTLDYKEAWIGSNDEKKKEFLADISSFANSAGGRIFYGISEKRQDGKNTGLPDRADGLSDIEPEPELLRLENIVKTGLSPRLSGIRMKSIAGFSNGPVIVIDIPRSLNAPHGVWFQNWGKFFVRTEREKCQMDVNQIRSSFLTSETLESKLQSFRIDRIARIRANET